MFKKISKLFVCALVLGFLTYNFSDVQASGSKANNENIKIIAGDNAGIINSVFPDKLVPGQEYPVSVTMVNSGDNEWTQSGNYFLKLFTGPDNQYQSDIWSITSVELPQDVYPTENVTFSFKITAPKTTGTYNIQWAMVKDFDFFGEYTNNIIDVEGEYIVPESERNEDNSEFISSIIPEIMTAGEKYKVSVMVKNTGKTEWSKLSKEYKIVPVIESSDNTYLQWNSTSYYLPNAVAPGQTSEIEFDVTAPSNPGIYSLQWIMEKGDNSFGQKSNRVTVSVSGNNTSSADTKTHDASFMEQSVPIEMIYDKTQDINITFSNTGDNTWTKGSEQLVMIDSKRNLVTLNSWNVGYIQLPESVEPGGLVTINFKVKPSETGWNYFQCSMMKSDGTLFGSPSQSVEVIVTKK